MIRAWMIAALAVLIAAGPAWSAEDVSLDAERRAALLALPAIQGDPLEERDLTGKPVVVTFFASWCPPCHAEFDHLKSAQNQYGDSVTIVAINIFELTSGFTDKTRLPRFLKRKAPPFHVVGEGEAVAGLFGKVARIPTVFVFDGRGEATLHFVHARGAEKTHVTPEELKAAISQALAAS